MVHLIEEAELRANAYMDKGCSSNDLLTALELAQDVMLQPKLGEALYNKVVEDLLAGLDSAYKTLFYKVCYPTLMYYTAYQLASLKLARITDSGVGNVDTDTSKPTGLEEHTAFVNSIRSLYKAYEVRMVNYIKSNSEDLPESLVDTTQEQNFSDSVQLVDTLAIREELMLEGFLL